MNDIYDIASQPTYTAMIDKINVYFVEKLHIDILTQQLYRLLRTCQNLDEQLNIRVAGV